MDSESLSLMADLMAAATGSCLTVEQRALLPASLSILKNEHGFSRVLFWGKLHGQTSDYLIAQGLGQSEVSNNEISSTAGGEISVAEFFSTLKTIPKKSFRLGPDGVTWTVLPVVDANLISRYEEFQKSLFDKGRSFTPLKGDAAHKYEFTAKTGPPATEGGEPTDQARELLEEERIAFMVHEIDSACSVVPVGAYVLLSSQQVAANEYFKGLSLSQGLKLDSYLHLRTPVVLPSKPAKERGALSKSTQFLDSLADDTPVGCWSVKQDAANGLIVLRSFLYPGYVHFNVTGSAMHGAVYVGSGCRNYDLAFAL